MQTHCLEIITLHLIKFLIDSKLFLLYKGLKYKKNTKFFTIISEGGWIRFTEYTFECFS